MLQSYNIKIMELGGGEFKEHFPDVRERIKNVNFMQKCELVLGYRNIRNNLER